MINKYPIDVSKTSDRHFNNLYDYYMSYVYTNKDGSWSRDTLPLISKLSCLTGRTSACVPDVKPPQDPFPSTGNLEQGGRPDVN